MYEYICISTPLETPEKNCKLTTVSCTEDMPPELIRELEKMDCFNPCDIPCDPVTLSCVQLRCGSEVYPLISHISPSTDGEERVAHHLIFRNDKELALCPGMAPGILRCDNFCSNWELLPEKLPLRMHLKSRKRLGHRAYLWEALLGDAGWAGVIAERFLDSAQKCIYLEFPTEYIDSYGLLELFGEVFYLLPPEKRTEFTFTTNFAGEEENCTCFLRAIPAGSALLEELRKDPEVMLLTPADPKEIPAEYAQCPLVKAAREMKPEKPAIPLASTLAATETPPEFSPETPAALLSAPRKVPTLQKTPLPQQKNKVNWVLYAIAIVLAFLLLLLVFYYIKVVDSTPLEGDDVIVIRENMRIN